MPTLVLCSTSSLHRGRRFRGTPLRRLLHLKTSETRVPRGTMTAGRETDGEEDTSHISYSAPPHMYSQTVLTAVKVECLLYYHGIFFFI